LKVEGPAVLEGGREGEVITKERGEGGGESKASLL
jgi:hypothetical protein